MRIDPHEPGQRREPFLKSVEEEEWLVALNEVLKRTNLPAPPCSNVAGLPILYIVGAPRSGTTLLSQIVSRVLPIGYINNFIARFWLRPSVGIRLSQAVLGSDSRDKFDFQSKHGVTKGPYGPHEFGYFWRHWLQLDRSPTHHLTDTALARVDQMGLKQALEQEVLGSFGTGVVFKNVICGFHARFLTRLHPLSLFLHIKRDPFAAAASILKTRMDRFGTYETWWSIKPSTYPFDTAKGDPAAEVARQVLDTTAEMEAELGCQEIQSITTSYESLCQAPDKIIQTVCARLGAMGVDLHPVQIDIPPLKIGDRAELPESLSSRLRECLTAPARV